MKILNVCLTGPFSDGWNYQDNLLTKYQSIQGNDVTIIAPKWSWNSNGKLEECKKCDYINDDNVHIIRLSMKGKENINKKFKLYKNLYYYIDKIRPDIIFVHGCQFLDLKQIRKYAKNNSVKIYIDNHADFSNSAKNWLSKNLLHKVIWKNNVKLIEPYVEKFYGVLPARVDFLTDVYKLPKNKTELLVMGADDKFVKKYCNISTRNDLRKKNGIENDDFLIVTGGKIDKYKTQTLLLMKSMKNMKKNAKLFVFGSVSDELKSEFDLLCKCNQNIKYLGWINEEESYKYFSIADLVVFPGRHSVYWEQVVALGVPMICKYWNGTTHIDIGGNVEFVYSDDNLEKTLMDLLNDKEKYMDMKEKACQTKKNEFLYSNIAKKSVGQSK